jgi:hypothetical protein
VEREDQTGHKSNRKRGIMYSPNELFGYLLVRVVEIRIRRSRLGDEELKNIMIFLSLLVDMGLGGDQEL